jgi:hypothetical protein
MESPIDEQTAKVIALEEGLSAAVSLDKLRLQMLHEAVDWIMALTDFDKTEVRRQLANRRGGQVALNLATINAVREML